MTCNGRGAWPSSMSILRGHCGQIDPGLNGLQYRPGLIDVFFAKTGLYHTGASFKQV